MIQDRYNNGDQKGGLADRYVTIPSSVFITYKGKWKERKNQWRELIDVNGKTRAGKMGDGGLVLGNTQAFMTTSTYSQCVSLFDPVLAEVMVRWFCPENGSVFDPFAGDTLKGLVFSTLGHKFTGIELRQEQVDENNATIKAAKAKLGKDLDITYFCDDGQNVANHVEANSQDLLFSCPPYYDLEVYSDLPNDASNQGSYEDFLKILENAFTSASKCLKDDRFAVVVVGDVRDKNGFYYDFPGDVKRIFKKIGMPLYNEAILVDTLSNKRFTANRSMSTRKLMKTHQNVLVFYKGDPKNIKQNFAPVDFSDAEINDMLKEMGEEE